MHTLVNVKQEMGREIGREREEKVLVPTLFGWVRECEKVRKREREREMGRSGSDAVKLYTEVIYFNAH
jgi:hypothetical protein